MQYLNESLYESERTTKRQGSFVPGHFVVELLNHVKTRLARNSALHSRSVCLPFCLYPYLISLFVKLGFGHSMLFRYRVPTGGLSNANLFRVLTFFTSQLRRKWMPRVIVYTGVVELEKLWLRNYIKYRGNRQWREDKYGTTTQRKWQSQNTKMENWLSG